MKKDKLKQEVVSTLYGSMKIEENDSLASKRSTSNHSIVEINIEFLEPNPNQPRNFAKILDSKNDKPLQELASSIKEFGVLEPILVKTQSSLENYQIIAGERRYRAACIAGLKSVPAIIKDISDNEAFMVALIENVQREDISPVAMGKCFQHMLDQKICKTMEQIAKKVSLSKTRVHQLLALLKLPQKIQSHIFSQADSTGGEKITEGHARQLLRLKDTKEQLKLFEKILGQGLSVRQTEKIVSSLLEEKKVKKENKPSYQNISNCPKSIKAKISPDNKTIDVKLQYQKGQDYKEFLENIKIILQAFEKEKVVFDEN